jgi:glycerol-3-phosphate acyltransferase PlsY
MIVLYYALLIIGSYFIGNISFAIIISKKKNGDITKVGSGNPGTMNMLRTYGFKLGFLTLVLDTLKGAIPSLIGLLIFGKVGLYTAGLSAILGHIFPVVRKFKGGKGIACTLGVFLVADPSILLYFLYNWCYLSILF